MKAEYVKVAGKLNADTLGCDPEYFKKYIKGKPLQIVHSTVNHYVRAQDQNQEEWGLFPGQYALITGLESPATGQNPKAEKKKLPG